MDNKMKKAMKITGAVCAGVGVMAASALVVSGAALGAMAEGFKYAETAMKRILTEQKSADREDSIAESVSVNLNEEKSN